MSVLADVRGDRATRGRHFTSWDGSGTLLYGPPPRRFVSQSRNGVRGSWPD